MTLPGLAAVDLSGGSDRWKVLVVDDEPNVRFLLEKLMQREGHDVCAAASGMEAMAELKQCGYDLLLTDKNIPSGFGGSELAKAARAAQPDICIVMVTGYASKESANQLMGVVDDYVVKPFQMKPLVQRLRDVMARRRALTARRKLAEEVSQPRQGEQERPRVLLIESEPSERALLARLLGELGLTVAVGAGPGDMSNSPEPDALVINARVCSAELDRAVWRRQARRGAFPVVILSDGDSLDASIRAVSLGASGRVVRPTDEADIRSVLARALATLRQ
jgi:DNA-binding response OmpR family regulator